MNESLQKYEELLDLVNKEVEKLGKFALKNGLNCSHNVHWKKTLFSPKYTFCCYSSGLVYLSFCKYFPNHARDINRKNKMNLKEIDFLIKNWDDFKCTVRNKIIDKARKIDKKIKLNPSDAEPLIEVFKNEVKKGEIK